MSAVICPFIGIETDNDTAVGFPSPRNMCHRSGSPVPTSIAYQARYCMAAEHVTCPIFQQQAGAALSLAAGSTAETSIALPVSPAPSKPRAKVVKPAPTTALPAEQPAEPRQRRAREFLLPLMAVAGVTAIMIAVLLILPPTQFFAAAPPNALTSTPTPEASSVTFLNGSSIGSNSLITATPSKSPSPPPTSTRALTKTAGPKTATTTLTATFTATNIPPAATACGSPAGWVQYTVRSGDTLSGLSRIFGIRITQLQIANCMGSSTFLYVGQVIWTPWIPPTQVVISPTISPTETTPSVVPGDTNTPEPSATVPTDTPEPSATVPTDTPVPPSPEPSEEVPTIQSSQPAATEPSTVESPVP